MNRKPTKRKTAKKPAAVIAPKALGHGEVSFGNLDARTIHVRDSRTGEIVGTLGDGGNTESLIIFDRTTGKPLVRMTKDGMFSLVGDCCFDFPHCISEALSHEGIPTPPTSSGLSISTSRSKKNSSRNGRRARSSRARIRRAARFGSPWRNASGMGSCWRC